MIASIGLSGTTLQMITSLTEGNDYVVGSPTLP
jgi:hypothetical protein